MIKAYDEISVRNVQLRKTAHNMLNEGQLTPPQYQQVKSAFPIAFKPINGIMRVGLFLFTSLCILFSVFLLGWILLSAVRDDGINILLLFCGVLLTVINEYFIRENKWYRQGSDNALCYASLICFCFGFYGLLHINMVAAQNFMCFIVITLFAWRYGDPVLAIAAYCALMFTVYSCANSALVFAFGGAIVSIAAYMFSKNSLKNEALFYWEDCFTVLEIASLIGLYLSLNYFFIHEFHKIHTYETPDVPMPLGWFFTFTTAILPIIYLVLGIKNRDRILWIMGSFALVASIMTYRYYYSVMPIEWALTLGGLVLLGLAFFLIRSLKKPRNGISYEPYRSKSTIIETLVVNQFLQSDAPKNDDTQFGGGDFGGGGATGDYS